MSALPAKVDFTIWLGATFRKRLTLYNSATPVDGEERDLTGYTAELIIRDKPQGTPLLTLESGTGITLGGVDGTIDLHIDATTTGVLLWRNGVYDLTITEPGPGDTDPLIYGAFHTRGV